MPADALKRSAAPKLLLLGGLAAAMVLLFLTVGVDDWSYALPRRLKKVAAIVLTGFAIALSTVLFQTITNNRILTPSIIGMDALYNLLQTLLVFAFGSVGFLVIDKQANYLLSVGLMMVFSALLYRVLFRRENSSIYLLLLTGLIFGTLFQSGASFMQALIDPDDFLVVQSKMFASFNNIEYDLLVLSSILIGAVLLAYWRLSPYMDALSLGRDHAVNLGIPYEKVTRRLLILIAVLVAVSTALVGPITFLGLLVANTAYQFLGTYRHSTLITGAALVSVIALVGGQFLVEHVFTFSTTISVIINFVGGVYFLYLLLKENRS
ncbi:iron chelate uptake ABC transporter family permease subunit [Paenibacillus albicereus]|uniref:Iron chelate uptake ABC transporter family permease subunit n=1 Tax=Paenibacillus albicereus TaxID=2726185 RepID=A0A6H2GS24_9BACL|nr:iron chelate uptake ABC transporter family permease subunit [Paenibacillus albicereus]QJC50200.1 iron chelate uptake ABC transporter family permease subunit [Paenibacillus albicereus]